jgi:hypothetical protein
MESPSNCLGSPCPPLAIPPRPDLDETKIENKKAEVEAEGNPKNADLDFSVDGVWGRGVWGRSALGVELTSFRQTKVHFG